jgi:hypothetical protein
MGLHTKSSSNAANRSNVVAKAPAIPSRGGGGGVVRSSPRVSWDEEFARRDQARAISDESRRMINRPEEEPETAPRLSNKQIDEYNAQAEALENAIKSGYLAPEEVPEARRQFALNQAGIKPEHMEKPSPFPQGQGIGEQWISEDQSTINTRNAKGEIQTKDNPAFLSPADKMKAAVDKGKVVAGIVQNFTNVATGETNWEQVNRVLKMAGLDVVEEDEPDMTPRPGPGARPIPKAQDAGDPDESAKSFVDRLLGNMRSSGLLPEKPDGTEEKPLDRKSVV